MSCPPPGKFKLVPLPFPTLGKLLDRPVSRRPFPMASGRPTATYPVWPYSQSVQPTLHRPSPPSPASTSLMDSAKAALPVSTSATRRNVANTIQSSTVPQLATSRPEPYRAPPHILLQRELVLAARNRVPSPANFKPSICYKTSATNQFHGEKNDLPAPVISQPFANEQMSETGATQQE